MANAEHLAMLHQGVAVWNRWRAEHPSIKPDLSGADLTRLVRADEADVDYLMGAIRLYTHDIPDLVRQMSEYTSATNFGKLLLRTKSRASEFLRHTTDADAPAGRYSSYLRGINFSHCNLSDANLEAAYMPESDLRHADCSHARFCRANLRMADLSRTRSLKACFCHADLEKAEMANANPCQADFTRAILRGAHLHGVSANEADFSGADLGYSSLTHVESLERDFASVTFTKTRLDHASFLRASFVGANLREVDLSETQLNWTRFVGAHLADARLVGSILQGSDLRGADLRGSNMENTNVSEVTYSRSGKYRGVRLAGCYGSARFERFAKDQSYLEELRGGSRMDRALFVAWNLFADCGRTPWRWIGWSLLFVVFFGVAYANYPLPSWLGWLPNEWTEALYRARPLITGAARTPFTPYYFSLVTFTTLGFGDVTPSTLSGEILVSIEVVLGYIMLGGLVSLLATLIARRS